MKPSAAPCDPAILGALRARAGGDRVIGFAEFMEVALYEPGLGYYRRSAPRVGYGPGTDFLTATASSPLFGKLVVASCVTLLGGADPAGFEFVEIGAEPGAGILGNNPHPFGSARTLRIGEPLKLSGRSVVFSNELFDAQPFRRFKRRDGQWRELGVRVGETGLDEAELPATESAPLPASAPEGYVIDAPLAASALAKAIADQPWSGLFLAFDYGKSWEELAFACPEGTARSYRRHVQGNSLLDNPGDQDLTCHVCWDWLADALRLGGFADPRVESQEAFFVHHGGAFLAGLAEAAAGPLSPERLSLLQLLHPANMGQRFQALWALRRA